MLVKIDTKEKFTEIKVLEHQLAANMTAELTETLIGYLQKEVKNIILILANVQAIDTDVAKLMVSISQNFYNNHASFVICELKPHILQGFNDLAIDDLLNITPTLSEAWDMVQMEEIERSFFEE